MNKGCQDCSAIEKALKEMAEAQNRELLKLARRILPTATADDILQPNDYRELEYHPEFRYEEGVLAGLQSALALLRCQRKISC